MKNLLLIALFTFLLNGCRYINTQEVYPDAKASKQLEIPEGLDKPNATSTLEVPQVSANTSNKNSNTPPDMPIRTKQSDSGNVRIENEEGFAVLTIQADKADVWAKMNQFELENWSLSDANEDACTISLNYNDQDARARENRSFFKKIFSRNKYNSDYTGQYKLTCEQKGSINRVKFSQLDGTEVKSFLSDSVMNQLFSQME
jgi:uncharacterized lipoprotein